MKKKEITKDKIIYAFLELIKTKEFEHISVKDITSFAHIHRITFYDYFQDKYELLSCIYEEMKDEAIQESSENSDDFNSYSSVSNYLHCFVNALKKRKQLVEALANQTGGYIYFAFETFLSDAFKKLIIYQHKERKLIYSIEQTSSFMIGAIISFVISGYRQGKYNDEQYESIFYDAQRLIRAILASNIIFKE